MKVISLKKRKDFLRVAASGQKAVAKGLLLQVCENNNPSADIINLGFTTTKKLGNAVKRNRIKRRLRAIARQVMPNRAKASFDYVLIGRTAGFDRDFADMVKDLKYALHYTQTHQNK
jgi:ribonuclease P protein component